jgi:hypothetical protein
MGLDWPELLLFAQSGASDFGRCPVLWSYGDHKAGKLPLEGDRFRVKGIAGLDWPALLLLAQSGGDGTGIQKRRYTRRK